jgi:hypothetical protein
VALGWPWGGLGRLCAALFLISAFSFQHFSFCPIVALGWLARPVTNYESRITSGFRWFCPAVQGSRFDVRGSKFSVFHKPFEYNSPPVPLWGWSGGPLVPPWTCPIPIDPPQTPVFDQPGLSKSLSCGSSVIRQQVRAFNLPERAADWQPKLQH